MKIIFSSLKNKSSDVNKTHINIRNGQSYNCQPKLDHFFVGKIGTVNTRIAKECLKYSKKVLIHFRRWCWPWQHLASGKAFCFSFVFLVQYSCQCSLPSHLDPWPDLAPHAAVAVELPIIVIANWQNPQWNCHSHLPTSILLSQLLGGQHSFLLQKLEKLLFWL